MHAQEPSYYEIALTNRQVLGFFVVLLLCVVGAFFSGIWLGKKQPGEGPMLAQAESVAAETTEAQEPLEELNFFTDEQTATATRSAPDKRQPERPVAAAAGDAGTTLQEDLAAPESRQANVDPPVREAPAVAPPAKIEAAESVPTKARTGFVIQVFSSPDFARAQQFLERLQGDGYAAFLVEEVVNGTATHRVRIGPFTERGEADRLKPLVAKAYKVEPWVAPIE